jgi:protein-disulfide isomerase
VLIVGGAVIVAIIVAVVLGIALSSGSSTPSAADAPAVGSLTNSLTLPGASQVDAMFKGIPQSGTTLGSSKAPVTMEEFIDPQCPYCQEFETQVLPTLVQNYVRAGKLRIQMEPWAFIGPDSVTGQAAELAAANQNRVFNFAEILYDNQRTENTGWLNTNMITAAAASIPGLQVHRLLSERGSSAVKAAQSRVDALATQRNITGTPTIFVGKTGTSGSEVAMTSATDGAAVEAAIKNAGG